MIFDFLDSNGISYERVDHSPVYTCEEAKELVPYLSGAETKNLFLRDAKGRRHFLVTVKPEKQVDLKSLSSLLNATGLGFASPERLMRYLKLEPGAVTLLGVVNDTDGVVEVIIDEVLWSSQSFLCHPLVNKPCANDF
jgi:Ala-tRNA(Pro) deacylase